MKLGSFPLFLSSLDGFLLNTSFISILPLFALIESLNHLTDFVTDSRCTGSFPGNFLPCFGLFFSSSRYFSLLSSFVSNVLSFMCFFSESPGSRINRYSNDSRTEEEEKEVRAEVD